MRVDELDYDLPERCIAQEPLARREDARLLVLDRAGGRTEHRGVGDLPRLLAPGDLVVLNDTRVLPARLAARRASGGAVEVLLLEPCAGESPAAWTALLRAGGRLQPGEALEVAGRVSLRLLADLGGGRWRIQGTDDDVSVLMERHGQVPLPPYIHRRPSDPREALDRERYQTVFGRRDGAVAAPTAGLHLTERLLAGLSDAGVNVAFLTLHVGLGTFAPVRAARFDDHAMHEEVFAIPLATAAAVCRTKDGGGRVVAVGTTTVRALESSAHASDDGRVRAEAGRTSLMILPGHAFRTVDALLTNFHLPRSTLLALVAAFAGRERVLTAYREAVAANYRFYSYGDAMLVL